MIGLFDRPVDDDEIVALRAEPVVPGLTDTLVGVGERDWNKAVAKLRQAGLLSEEQDKRLDAHPLVREHFGEQLRREQPEAWREGHRRLYEHLKTKTRELPETVEEMAPLYAAVVHGCQAERNQEALDEVRWRRIRRKEEQFSTRKLGAFGSEVAVLSAFFEPPWERLASGLSEATGALVLNKAGFALRALGRLSEAAGLMRMALDRTITQQDWKSAAADASNLSELLQARGELRREALAQAVKSVELADKSGEGAWRMASRTTLAAAQHAMGLREEAAAQLEEAEKIQKEWQPAYPLVYSLPGFRYCDLLLDQGRDADVLERGAAMLATVPSWYSLLDVALDHLSLGRAYLLAVQRGTAADLARAASHIQYAVDGLRRAGTQDHLPLALLARAGLHTHTRAFDLARKDLDETLTFATRCGFRLHEADAHLAYARLSLAEAHPALAADHLAKARAIIEATGYHRRDDELADLESTLPSPPLQPLELPHGPDEEGPAMPHDIAVICALPSELKKVLKTGALPWTLLDLRDPHPDSHGVLDDHLPSRARRASARGSSGAEPDGHAGRRRAGDEDGAALPAGAGGDGRDSRRASRAAGAATGTSSRRTTPSTTGPASWARPRRRSWSCGRIPGPSTSFPSSCRASSSGRITCPIGSLASGATGRASRPTPSSSSTSARSAPGRRSSRRRRRSSRCATTGAS